MKVVSKREIPEIRNKDVKPLKLDIIRNFNMMEE